MIICYKCNKELKVVWEIGEIVRSYDGSDFCFCKACWQELEQMEKDISDTEKSPKSDDIVHREEDDEDYSDVMQELIDSFAFADEGIFPIGEGLF